MRHILRQSLDSELDQALQDTRESISNEFTKRSSYPSIMLRLSLHTLFGPSSGDVAHLKSEILNAYLSEVLDRYAKLNVLVDIASRLRRSSAAIRECFNNLRLEVNFDELSLEELQIVSEHFFKEMNSKNYTFEQAYAYFVSSAEHAAFQCAPSESHRQMLTRSLNRQASIRYGFLSQHHPSASHIDAQEGVALRLYGPK